MKSLLSLLFALLLLLALISCAETLEDDTASKTKSELLYFFKLINCFTTKVKTANKTLAEEQDIRIKVDGQKALMLRDDISEVTENYLDAVQNLRRAMDNEDGIRNPDLILLLNNIVCKAEKLTEHYKKMDIANLQQEYKNMEDVYKVLKTDIEELEKM